MANNLILHIPHSSTVIPDFSGYLVGQDVLEKEMLLLTDWYTDDLFSVTDGIKIVADFNRIFCDVERFADDEQEVMSKFGMGVIYERRDDGSDLRNVSAELRQTILEKYYHPHHHTLNVAVTEMLLTHDRALIIDCHSFSNEPFKRDLDKHTPRPGICIGTDSYHTPEGLLEFTYTYFKLAGYTVQINTPYSGSIVPMDYYHKDKRVHSIMIEVNRDVYMVPGTNTKSRGYIKLQRALNKYLHKVSELMYYDYPDLRNEDCAIPPEL